MPIKDNLTVVISVKNRASNLQWCLESIRCNNKVPNIIVVDFGSDIPVRVNDAQVIRVTRNTQVFHKARAVNIGLKAVKTPYACVTDADQIFQNNFFDAANDAATTINNVYITCGTYRLFYKDIVGMTPECLKNDYAVLHARARKNGGMYGDGCFHAAATSWFLSTGGYDEQIIGWGFEDTDMSWRAGALGKRFRRLYHHTSTLHLPHSKKGPYYDAAANNKKYYASKVSMKITFANRGRKWGAL